MGAYEYQGTSCTCTVTTDAGASDTICSGTCTTLNGSVSGGTPNYIYSWTSSPAGFTSNDSITTVCPDTTTTYTLTVTDSNGCTDDDRVIITVNTFTVSADFSSTQTSGCAPLTVHLASDCTGFPTSHTWAFGDGDTSTDTSARPIPTLILAPTP